MLALTVIFAFAAFAIDMGQLVVARHRAQLAADSGALAGAADFPSQTTSIAGDATTLAHDNVPGGTVTVSEPNGMSGTQVQVKVSQPVALAFGNLFKISTGNVSANAVAAYTAGSSTSPCTGAAQSADECAAIYTASSACTSSAGFISGSSDLTVDGGIHSQGYMSFPEGTYTFEGPVTYSSGNCTPNEPQPGDFKANSPTAGGNQSTSFWPDDYSKYFTACTGAACTGPGGTPSYCANAAASYQFSWSSYPPNAASAPTGVYCAYGTGTPSNPSTWNGSLDFDSSFTPSTAESLTLIGGSVDFNGSATLSPAVDGCLMYVTDTDSQSGESGALYIDGGNQALNGGMFAPNGTIYISQTGNSSGFLEAQNVNLSGLTATITGNGPVLSSSASPTPSSYSLVQ